MPRNGVLYISYDGILEPLGESQVVSYVVRLATTYQMVVLSFEKSHDWSDTPRCLAMTQRLRAAGVQWIPLRYHKHPAILSSAYDILVGTGVGVWVALHDRLAIAHARGYVAAAIAWMLKALLGLQFLFDMRGFWPDEKVSAGHWRADSWIYRLTKRFERRFLTSADALVSLTEAGIQTLRTRGLPLPSRIACIPTCTDLQRFQPGPRDATLRHSLRLDQATTVIGCVGSLNNWYMRAEMLGMLAALVRDIKGLHVLCVTHEDHVALREDARRAGVDDQCLHIRRAQFAEMPAYIRQMDCGLFFITPTLAKQGSAATKLGEFLACGVPVIINDGVGDSGEIVRRGQVGLVLDHVPDDSPACVNAVRALVADPQIARRCRQLACDRFDVEEGAARYRQLYADLLPRRCTPVAHVALD